MRKLIGSDLVIERAYEELNQFNWTEEELFTYEQETKRIMDNQAAEDYMLKQAKSEGKAEGVEIGKAERDIEIAKAMLLDGDSAEKIAKITGLSIADINKLKS